MLSSFFYQYKTQYAEGNLQKRQSNLMKSNFYQAQRNPEPVLEERNEEVQSGRCETVLVFVFVY